MPGWSVAPFPRCSSSSSPGRPTATARRDPLRPSPGSKTMILICYDGSEDAKSAIQHAGTLLPGSPATVLTVWEPYITILTRTPGGMGPVAGVVDIEELDKGSREAAEREAAEGAALAHDAGIDAQSATVARHASVAEAILEESDRLDAS